MTLTRLIFCLALLGVLPLPQPLSGPAAAAVRELRVATLRIAPGGDQAESSEASAIAELNQALTRELCRRLAAHCSQHPLPFVDIIPGVESGHYQLGVGNVLRTPEREARVLFSQSLWRSSSRLVGTAKSIGRLRPADGSEIRLNTLRNVSIAVERGTQQHRYVSRLAASQGLRLVEGDTVDELQRALLDGRADLALMPVRSAYFLLARQTSGKLEFTGPALTEEGLGGTVHLILPKGEEALRREVDAVIDAMRKDGTFQRIFRRYMPFLAD